MIRIVFIITGLSSGGAEVMLLKVLQRLDRKRFLAQVISLTNKGEIGARIEQLGIPVEALQMGFGPSGFNAFVQLAGRLRELRPDAVHTWMYHADLIGGIAAKLAGIKALGWALHNSNLAVDKSKRSTRVVMRCCALISDRVPRRILSCSDRARLVHIAAGYSAKRMVVIPNGFDLNLFHPNADARAAVRAELGLAHDTPIVGLIARFDPQKNHLGFIEAIGLVHQSLGEVHFVLAGSGVDATNPALVQAIADHRLQESVSLLGHREDIPRLMASLDVLASSSHSEAFPNVLGEAMSCGVPCVATDAGDSAEIVGDTGRVVPVANMTALAQEIVDVLQLPLSERQALGDKARQRVQDRYEIGRIVSRYEQFYLSLISGSGPCAA